MAKKTGTTAQAATSSITKQEAVRRALAALSKNATAKDIQEFIKDTFNLVMTIDHIYTAKSSALAKGKKKATTRKVKPPAPPETLVTIKPTVQPVVVARQPAAGIRLEDIEVVKGLLGRVSADNLKALTVLLAR